MLLLDPRENTMTRKIDVAQILNDISLFSCMEKSALTRLIDEAGQKTYPKNTILFSEGDETDSLYIVLKGRVKAFLTNQEGKEIILAVFGPGEYFGEMALIDKGNRSATIMTKEQTRVIIISGKSLRDLLASDVNITLNLLKELLDRFRDAQRKIKSLALMDVYGRVTRLLLQLADKEGNERVIKEPITHQEIANMVGSSREMVSRIMQSLTTGNYIEKRNRKIFIRKDFPYNW